MLCSMWWTASSGFPWGAGNGGAVKWAQRMLGLGALLVWVVLVVGRALVALSGGGL